MQFPTSHLEAENPFGLFFFLFYFLQIVHRFTDLKNCFFLAKTSFEIHNKQVKDTRKSLGEEELSDKSEEEIQTMQEDMKTEEGKLNQTREKLSR